MKSRYFLYGYIIDEGYKIKHLETFTSKTEAIKKGKSLDFYWVCVTNDQNTILWSKTN